MKKKLLSLAVLGLLSPICFASNAAVSGFADITLTSNDDVNIFLANAEVDIENKLSDKVSVRIDTDLAITTTNGTTVDGPNNSAVLEQVFFAYSATSTVTVLGGVINNPIGWETEDAPGLYQVSHGQIYGILDGQTALYGNNVAGIAVAAKVGSANITLAVLDDIGLTDLKENSFAAVLNMSPMTGLDIELGYVTQPNQAENVWDANVQYKAMGATVGIEFLGADKAIDLAYAGTVNYAISKMFAATVRIDNVSYEADGVDDSKSYAIAGIANVAKNLTVLIEYNRFDNGTTEDDKVVAEFVAAF